MKTALIATATMKEIFVALQATLLVLQAAGIINWPWWWVLAPALAYTGFIATLALAVALLLVFLAVLTITARFFECDA